MLDCPQFAVKRAKYFTVSSLRDLFHYVIAHVIADFINDIVFYNHLYCVYSPRRLTYNKKSRNTQKTYNETQKNLRFMISCILISNCCICHPYFIVANSLDKP